MLYAISAIIECEHCCHLCDIEIDIISDVPINNQLVSRFTCSECGTINAVRLVGSVVPITASSNVEMRIKW